MNKREFLKSTAALAVAPTVLSRTTLAAASPVERQILRTDRKSLGPTPAYTYDSDTNRMTFYRADPASFQTFSYMAA